MNAADFLKELKKEHLSGREFLALIGYSDISNEDYSEIKETPDLSYARLVEILEGSPLKSEDYSRLLQTARERAVKKAQKKSRRDLESGLNAILAEKTDGVKTREGSAGKAPPDKQEPLLSGGESEPAPKRKTAKTESLPRLDEITEEITLVGGFDDVELPEDGAYEDLWGDETADNTDALDEYNSGDYTGEFDEYGGSEDFDENANKENFSKRVICVSLGIVLAFLSFFIRYMTTGEWGIPDTAYKNPESYEDIFTLQSEAVAQSTSLEPFERIYRAEKFDDAPSPLLSLCHSSDYIFKTDGDAINAVKISQGLMSSAVLYKREDMRLHGIFIQKDRLYAVYSGEYEVSFDYVDGGSLDGDEDDTDVKVFTFTQPCTVILSFDAYDWNGTPIGEYTQDGEFSRVITRGDNIFLVTNYSASNNVSNARYDGYIPAYSFNSQRGYVPMDNIVFVKDAVYSDMTVIGGIGQGAKAYAVYGGKADGVYEFASTLMLTLSAQGRTTLVKYGIAENALNNPVSTSVNGEVQNGFADERNGITRVAATVGEGESRSLTLYVLGNDMKQSTSVEKIAVGEDLRGAAFDGKTVYIIAEQLYAINTSAQDSPVFLKETDALITDSEYYKWGDKNFFSIDIDADSEGRRQGVIITMYSYQSGEPPKETDTLVDIPPNSWKDTVAIATESMYEAAAVSYDAGIIVVPIVYFNGICKVERFIIIGYDDSYGFEVKGYITEPVSEYEFDAKNLSAVISEGYVYNIFGDMVMSSTTSGTVVDKYTWE